MSDDRDSTTLPESHGDAPSTARRDRARPDQFVEVTVSTRALVKVVGVVLATLGLLWAADAARDLVSMLIISTFFALALVPGVNYLQHRYEWRRGAAVGVIYVAGLVAMVLLILVLIPAIAEFAQRIGESGEEWIEELDTRLEDTIGIDLISEEDAESAAGDASSGLDEWSEDVVGGVLSIASSGVGLLFQLATIAMFTFYFAADFPKLLRSFLSWFSPDMQQRLGWTIDEAVRQTGGYFYSRLLLMVINGLGFFAVLVAVGMSVALAIPLSLFGGFVSVFIPAIGTYIGGAVPIVITLADRGLTAALIVLAYVVLYQQIENYWLSPRLSAKTMTLNGGLAFGAAIGGGALFGPMGAFMALPVAALITSFIKNYRKANEVVYRSIYDTDEPAADAGGQAGPAADGAT
ncbi:AI-2E family transporter [Ilumatobacter sp.]|uniref:AI-2E family transporter n=1 Tax=Ilumatobacter sp. TaxID=1967498 RepID=UPI003AF82B57